MLALACVAAIAAIAACDHSTAPQTTVAAGTQIVTAGDIADSNFNYDSLTARILDTLSGTVLPLGDNAYDAGTLHEYQRFYDPTWGRQKARSRPVPGNHEYNTPGATGYFDYWGALAGDRDKGYYSYNVGAWHLVALNSEVPYSATSAQLAWLRSDLAANGARCVLAYWHRPRFSSGDHGSDASFQPLWQVLYDAGVDVVLNGHDHDYERFAPQDPGGNADPALGIREFVVGTGGAALRAFTSVQPNSEVRLQYHGVMRMTLRDAGYSWAFISMSTGVVRDSGSAGCH